MVIRLLGPPPKLSIRMPRARPLSMKFWVTRILLLPSKIPIWDPAEPVIVLPLMVEEVVLKNNTPFPSLVIVLQETVMFDCEPGRVDPRFTAGPPLPVNVLLSI